jgi:MurNAc alpha-1-phosphate uridylyltransferase|tara:strand:- start:1193 stop:1954 length:762 start_codon:yes stop_codon:yes gene_type:complete
MAKKSKKSKKFAPKTAMVLAAGLGLRLRPITDKIPKPLVKIADRTLLDHTLDRLVAAGVERAVVNIHHLADQVEQHLTNRQDLEIIISSETDDLLETGGGVKKALPHLGDEPFYISNADVLLLNGPSPALGRLCERWNDEELDVLLLLHSTVEAYGYTGNGDFIAEPDGKLGRKMEREVTPYLFTGVQIVHPRIFEAAPEGAFSLNVIYDTAIEAERLFGVVHDGEWFHIGTPDGLTQAEVYMGQRFSGMRHR